MAVKMAAFAFAVLLLGTQGIPSSVGLRIMVVATPAETPVVVPAAEKPTISAASKKAGKDY